jgi:hypothetical protein
MHGGPGKPGPDFNVEYEFPDRVRGRYGPGIRLFVTNVLQQILERWPMPGVAFQHTAELASNASAFGVGATRGSHAASDVIACPEASANNLPFSRFAFRYADLFIAGYYP